MILNEVVNYKDVDLFEYYNFHSDHFSIWDHLKKINFKLFVVALVKKTTSEADFLSLAPEEIHDFYWR
jgi:hypothetical protein